MFDSPAFAPSGGQPAVCSAHSRLRRRVLVGWGDTDFNGHLRNVAYLDKAADIRLLFFAQHGFSAEVFAAQRFGPVMQRDQIEYLREIRLLEEVEIDLQAAGLAQDGSRFLIRNDFYRADGQLAARITSSGGWLDLDARRLVAPPHALLAALHALPRAADFQQLASSISRTGTPT